MPEPNPGPIWAARTQPGPEKKWPDLALLCIYNFLVTIKAIARVILAVVIVGITVPETEACSGGSEPTTPKSAAVTNAPVTTTAPATTAPATTASATTPTAAPAGCKYQ